MNWDKILDVYGAVVLGIVVLGWIIAFAIHIGELMFG